jgi:Cu(I)/Ag(I) efflux system membrane protein CusA/SilA
VLKADPSGSGTAVLLKDVARIELGPDERHGIAEMNGTGEVVGGVALTTIDTSRTNSTY